MRDLGCYNLKPGSGVTRLPCASIPLWMCCECASVSPGGGAGRGDPAVPSRPGHPALLPSMAPGCLVDGFLDFFFPLAGKPKASLISWGGEERCCAGAELGAPGCTCSHPAATATLPPVTLQPPPSQGPSPRASCSWPCSVTTGRGVPVPGPGPHPCPHPQLSTHPSPRSPGDGSALSWEMSAARPRVTDISRDILAGVDRLHWLPWQVPTPSPCPWPWVGMETSPGGLTHPWHRVPGSQPPR